ncbi:uncharacterized protein BJ171DRAFT_514188 [Polychytrium aggregatum]|uniref:uncharacterized protein n=1 Tax=Polychytrium aggregatum TaxID=110093 RepID=UPI0022FEC205|nr:uncharacterized protein BJ171DRAFT_514188 [Polychytrium aggregatum]KAI9202457.1 hypothetical protein BJ171DRAFT_514188 [Polychytrium aggregatum]
MLIQSRSLAFVVASGPSRSISSIALSGPLRYRPGASISILPALSTWSRPTTPHSPLPRYYSRAPLQSTDPATEDVQTSPQTSEKTADPFPDAANVMSKCERETTPRPEATSTNISSGGSSTATATAATAATERRRQLELEAMKLLEDMKSLPAYKLLPKGRHSPHASRNPIVLHKPYVYPLDPHQLPWPQNSAAPLSLPAAQIVQHPWYRTVERLECKPDHPESDRIKATFDRFLESPSSVDLRELVWIVKDQTNALYCLDRDQAWTLYSHIAEKNALMSLDAADWVRLVRRLHSSILQAMKKHGCVPTAEFYAIIFRPFKNDHKKILQIHSYMLQEGLKQDPKNLAGLPISDLSIRTMLALMLRSKHSFPKSLSVGTELWRFAKQRSMPLSMETCLGFLELPLDPYQQSELSREQELVMDVYRYMNILRAKEPRVWDQSVTEAVLRTFAAVSLTKPAKGIWEDIQKPESTIPKTLQMYKSMLKVYVDEESFSRASALGHEMTRRQYAFDDEINELLLLAYQNMGDIDSIRQIIHTNLSAASAELVPEALDASESSRATSKSYQALVKTYVKMKQWDRAQSAYRELEAELLQERTRNEQSGVYKEFESVKAKLPRSIVDSAQISNEIEVTDVAHRGSSLATVPLSIYKEFITIPHRSTQAAYVYTLARRLDFARLDRFFRAKVVTPEALRYHWFVRAKVQYATYLSQLKHLDQETKATRNKRKQGSESMTNMDTLKAKHLNAKGEFCVCIDDAVGFSGPFKSVYQSLKDGVLDYTKDLEEQCKGKSLGQLDGPGTPGVTAESSISVIVADMDRFTNEMVRYETKLAYQITLNEFKIRTKLPRAIAPVESGMVDTASISTSGSGSARELPPKSGGANDAVASSGPDDYPALEPDLLDLEAEELEFLDEIDKAREPPGTQPKRNRGRDRSGSRTSRRA